MAYLLDTGILLRLIQKDDPHHHSIRQALRVLRRDGERLCITSQNLGEFWNVSTRPTSARGGYGMTIAQAEQKTKLIERLFDLLPDGIDTHRDWRRLLVAHSVSGVQVHDARLVALMTVHQVSHMLTLNPTDFTRYPFITAVTPAGVIAQI